MQQHSEHDMSAIDHAAVQEVVTQIPLNWEGIRRVVPKRSAENLAWQVDRAAPGIVDGALGSLALHLAPDQVSPRDVHQITAHDVRQHYGGDPFTLLAPDGFLEKRARAQADRTAAGVAGLVQELGATDSPKETFLEELGRIFDYANKERQPARVAKMAEAAGRWGTREDDPRITYFNTHGISDRGLANEDIPLIRSAVRALFSIKPGLRAYAYRHTAIKLATPEIMQGLRSFLEAHGRNPDQVRVAHSRLRTFLMTRNVPFVSRRMRNKLSEVPDQLQKVLTQVYELLPEDGRQFEQGVKNVVVRAAVQASRVPNSAQGVIHSFLHRLPSLQPTKHSVAPKMPPTRTAAPKMATAARIDPRLEGRRLLPDDDDDDDD